MRHSLAIALLLSAAGSVRAAAQGTLSTQGFGYPPGQLSTRAASMGGGLAETDPLSPINPAAISEWIRSGLYVQYSPEYRSVNTASGSDHTMTVRFPVMMGAVNAGDRVVIGLSTSTLLDRTWETSRTGYTHSGSDSVQFLEDFASAGAINDIRLGVAFAITPSLWIGAGGHIFSGDDRLKIRRVSTETTSTPFVQQSRLSYSGTGLSGGVTWRPMPGLTLGASGRVGGDIKTFRNDTSLTRATVPSRWGVGASFTGVSGLLVTARADWEGWSSIGDLGRPGLGVTDAWDMGGGVELTGPLFFGLAFPLRAGFRHRTLPFTVNGTEIVENSFTFGAGIPIAGGRSRIDLGAERANRGSVGGVTEKAWILSAGFMVRP
ncbi:MAG TPA: hypothetical protein VFK39_14485 [Gemmatimonadaceae bacterium]|nr:hypothetical protein [Gemmatimonadaceae bacterium]